MSLIILIFSSFFISLLAVAFIKQRFSQQLLDIPNERSSHTQPTPRGGGLGFIIAFGITSGISVFLTPSSLSLLPLWLIVIPLAIIGIWDDRQSVPASIRYLVQLAVSGIAIFYFGSFPQPWLLNFGIAGQIVAIALTLIGITAFINFYNFMDGLDGLVAGCAAVQLSFLAFYLNLPILWLLVAAVLGFLVWNWSPAKIFMGDTGSTVLGVVVAIALLNSTNAVQAWSALAITLPLVLDAIYTLCFRLSRGENIFQAHRSHLYQRLQKSGLPHAYVATIYICINILVAFGIIYFGEVGAWVSLITLTIAFFMGNLYLQSTLSPTKAN